MPQKQFSVKPHYIHALAPRALFTAIKYLIATLTVYYIMQSAIDVFALDIYAPYLVSALTVVGLLLLIIDIKPKLISLHFTEYTFYDTHVECKKGAFMKKKVSTPYNQISNVLSSTSIWDRMLNASDITLKISKHDEKEGIILYSVPDAGHVEHQIYRLLKKKTESSTN